MTAKAQTGQKTIFITGGAGGMGLATGQLFAEHGWFVGLFDIDEATLQQSAASFDPNSSMCRRLDVTDEDDFSAAMDAFSAATGGRLDVMFNNAGIAPGAWFDEMSMDTIRQIIDINVFGVIIGTRLALPLLKNTALKNTGGSINVSTSSSVATYGHALRAVYAASKYAVKGLTEALSLEFERFGVRAADVLPGCIDTPMLRNALAAGAGRPFDESMFDGMQQQGAYRLMPVSAIADAVWNAYHDEHAIHWYVPEEVGDIDRMDIDDARALTKEFLFNR
jgi:NAD(P)-dependent dehydrogenase (short-subunit alcohol dehydrogenase family)